MPLVRAEVRNEYALGAPELYREAKKEDPKEILEGVAVAGLVGVLRQLGDLAEFAAEVFHGLQEEVTLTSSRSHKLMARVQRIEAALSPLEKALLAQRSHLHFAYTAGSNWHTRIRSEQNHFIYSDLPQFIMDAYEDGRRPPSLNLLDKFDPGGPGSCLKRYSDPTFFKRASEASGEASTDKSLKDKKGRKIKKRRSWPRNGKVSRDASFSYNSGRVQFTPLNIGAHTSPSQTASTYDATLRSDLGEQSNLNLRNGSGYIEGSFRPSYSVEPEEQESRESISSPIKRNESDFLDYNFLFGKITDAHDDIPINVSQEQAGYGSPAVTLDEKRETPEPINISPKQAGCISSSVNWDGKIETLEPTTQYSDNDGMSPEDSGNIPRESISRLDLETLGDAPDFKTFEKVDVQPCNQVGQDPESGDVHLDDIESETDHFMDALNTIESESETDMDCRKKQEAEHHSKLEEKGVDDIVLEPTRHNSECRSSSSESNVEANSPLINGSGHSPMSMSPKSPCATNCLISEVAAKDEVNSVLLLDKDLQSSQTGYSVSSVRPQSIDSHDNGSASANAGNCVEPVSSTMSSNFVGGGPGIQITDGTRSSPDAHKEAPETSNATSVSFWTNGGLLGLQPSKPPDFSFMNAIPQDSEYNNVGTNSSSIQHVNHSEKDSGKPDRTESLKNIEEGLGIDDSECHEYQETGASFRKTAWKISPADLDINLGKLVSSLNQNNINSTGSSVGTYGSFLPVNSALQADKKHQENTRSSSQMFDLSSRLLSAGSNKKLLPGGVENTYPDVYKSANAFEQKKGPSVGHRTFSGRSKDLFGGESPLLSPSSSPPLQHMKISFQPIEGFESSKLKLKFPDRNVNNESSIDIFPSFQLVPDMSIARYHVGSESDADTFYRSSPSLSDDCHSNQSESNSEQWESSESPTSKDHDLYDALRRISLSESVSTLPGNGRTNQEDIHGNLGLQSPLFENRMQSSESFRSSDLQSITTISHSFRKELRNDTNSKDLLDPQLVTTPFPPPLPPIQWQETTPHLNATEDKYGTIPEGSYYAADLTRSASTISQPKPAPFSEDQIDTRNMQNSKQSSSQKSNGHREANQSKSIDETDFLHQIRSKSFSLRPIGTTKPTAPSGASTNVQVTAILQKANAIRQAVGSDGEDDGTWSDT